eukprot:PITA_00063
MKVVDIKLKRLKKAGESSSVCALVIKRVMRCFGRRVWHRIMVTLTTCSIRARFSPSVSYHRLKRSLSASVVPDMRDLEACEIDSRAAGGFMTPVSDIYVTPSGELTTASDPEADDTVVLKIAMMGDSGTGKTSFMVKYVSSEKNEKYVQTVGISSKDKVIRIKGHQQFTDIVPIACQDATAILIMFDLTRRSTLNSVMDWYQQARQYNPSAILVLVGTKFDHFIHLPRDIQSTIVKQARVFAHAMEAILFFSSVTHNINVNKIFKVITAKLFDLPCNIARNLTVGEPIIDF